MKIQEIFDELVSRGATIHNLKSSVRKLPIKIRKPAMKKYSLLENRFRKQSDKEAKRMEIESRSRNVAKWRKAGLSYTKDKEKAWEIMGTMRGMTGYSMGETIRLFVAGHYLMTMDNTDEYAKSSKWKAAHGDIVIKLTKPEFDRGSIVSGRFCVPKNLLSGFDNLWESKYLGVDGHHKDTVQSWTSSYYVETGGYSFMMHDKDAAIKVAFQEPNK